MVSIAPLKNPLILALDLDNEAKAWELVESLSDIVGGVKLGPRALLRMGPSFLKQVAEKSPVFLDMKFFDIPSTMVSAVRAAFDLGVSLVTVHAQAGQEALSQLAQIEAEYRKTKEVRLLAVTILTSFDSKTLPSILKTQSIDSHVDQLAQLVLDSGLSGLVCSPHELSTLVKYKHKELYTVVPGIRLEIKPSEDQKRVMGPQEALKAGATALVVGRPIIEALHPREVCEKILSL